MKVDSFVSQCAALLLGLLAALPADAQTRVGEVIKVAVETPHPYPHGTVERPVVWRHRLHHAGATFIKVHFADLRLNGTTEKGEPRGDYLVIRDADGAVHQIFSGVRSGGHWARAVPGDTALIELHADAKGSAFGLVIDRYGAGTAALLPTPETPLPKSVCGLDNRTGICGALAQDRVRVSDPVARLLFANDCGGLYLCTGFLFAADGRLMTNAHCANSPSESKSLEVWFNYIDDGTPFGACSLGGQPVPDVYEARALLQSNCNLDFAVHLVGDPAKGNPADRYGYLELSDRLPQVGEPIWLPQHPHGFDKRISEVDADVSSGSAPGIDFCADPPSGCFNGGSFTGADTELGYTADTEGGASGSPVIDGNNRVVALHHAGGCGFAGGENAGVRMNEIMAALSAQGAGGLAVKRLNLSFASGKLSLDARLDPGDAGPIDPPAQEFNLTIADDDGEILDLTLPPGSFSANGAGTRWTYMDREGAIGGLAKVALGVKQSTREIKVLVIGKGMELAGADRPSIDIGVAIGSLELTSSGVPCQHTANKAACRH